MNREFRSRLRRLVISEIYKTSLSRLFEQEGDEKPVDPAAGAETPPADPAAATPDAAAPPPDPGAAPPPADPAAGAPPVDPALTALPAPALPGGSAMPPMPADPMAAVAPPPTAAPAEKAKKVSAPPNPEKEPMKAQVNKALMKAQAAALPSANESLRHRSLRFLMEAEEEPKIDLGVYAGELAKLIKNYTSLIDVKKNVISQAEQYLDDEYPGSSEPLKKQLRDLLRTEYHVSLERPEPPADSYAIGAKQGGGAA